MAEPTDLKPLRDWRRRKPGTREVVRSETRVELPDAVLKRLADIEQRLGNLELASGETLPANDKFQPGIDALHREYHKIRTTQIKRDQELTGIHDTLQHIMDRVEALEGLASAINEHGASPAISIIRNVLAEMAKRQERLEADVQRAEDAQRTLTEIARLQQDSLKQLEAS